ncbi:MAG: hypothetical protein IPK16_00950 [Anaerolineales bacterium]|nr:hypothetical protein [Anaerolineales bacterium]
MDNWIFNPGSPENCSVAEAFWRERGYLLVEADTEKREHQPGAAPRHHYTVGITPRRACRLYTFDCDTFATTEALMAALVEFLTRSAAKLNTELKSKKTQEFGAPIVELYLSGVLAFDRSALDFGAIEQALETAFSPLVAIVKNLTQATAFEIEFDATQTRAELERTVISGIFARDARYAPNSVAWAQLTVELKQLALNGASPEAIIDTMAARIAQSKDDSQSDSTSPAEKSIES